jgi:hypothetical protein
VRRRNGKNLVAKRMAMFWKRRTVSSHQIKTSIPLERWFLSLSAEFGAGDGIRTHDPNLGKVVLYP